MMQEKILRIQAALAKRGQSGALLGNFGHQVSDDILYYLTLRTIEAALLYIPVRGKPKLYATPFEVPEYKKLFPEMAVLSYTKKAAEIMRTCLPHGGELSIRTSVLPQSVYAELSKLKGVVLQEADWCDEIISEKSSAEIDRIEKACALTDVIFSAVITAWPKFATENDAARFILEKTFELGAEPSFPPIVASGASGADPHHSPTDARLRKGFCVLDFGVRLNGYCSDMTRTIYLGRPSRADTALYAFVLSAQTEGIAGVRAGVPACDVDASARALLGKYKKFFIHSLGHGLGTQVHEWPRISKKSSAMLKENMVITIEPGLYFPARCGIRIEDDIVVRAGTPTVLTKSRKDLICLPL